MLIKLHNLIEDATKTIGTSDKIGIPFWVFSGISLEFLHVSVSDLEYYNQIVKLIIQIGIGIFVYYRVYKVFKKGK